MPFAEVRRVSWRYPRRRAFVFTLDALIAALLIGGMLGLFAVQEENLDEIVAYQQAQDIMAVCARLDSLDKKCFDFLKEENPSAKYALYSYGRLVAGKEIHGDAFSVRRQKLGEEAELRVRY